ncbi:MAG TPA: endo-1,4-beta-xylanase [Pseudolabrys sp.]|nr:endo-1,4-beta-xylanase [Pseudolabrys sp.]
MIRVPRRTILAGLASIGVASLSRTGLAALATLKEAAQARGLIWGAAVQQTQLRDDAEFAALVAQQCSSITPEWEMKWASMEARKGQRNFARADAMVAFAKQHGIGIRGHALVWHRSVPDWALNGLAWDAVAAHVEAMLRRYGGAPFAQWDVLNEVIEPNDGRDDGLRNSPFLKALGPGYIGRTLTLARATAPNVNLYINEYSLDYDSSIERTRRDKLLRLIDSLRKASIPLDGVGIQAHLRIDKSPFSAEALRRFLAELASRNVKIAITELDVREQNLELPAAERDRIVAAEVKRYLDVVLDEPAVTGITAWGLSDRYSWRTTPEMIAKGLRNRGLPFDEALEPKPFRDTIVAALERAPAR